MPKVSKKYNKAVEKATPPSPKIKNEGLAFLFGGIVCTLGQLLFNFYSNYLSEDNSKMLVSVTVIFLTALFTCLHLYEYYAKVAGGGSLVPISGFANSMASASMEFKSEGLILGTGAKMFSIAGPVLVYGISAGVIYGVILYIIDIL